MKNVPRLRLEPAPSRIGIASLAVGCAATVALIATLPVPLGTRACAIVAIVGLCAYGGVRCFGRGVPALLHVGADRRLTVTDRAGRSRDGAIVDDSYVGARLTTIVWRPDGAPWWQPARSILVLADMLPADDFRRLRVLLRYGRAGGAADTSGDVAG